MFSRVAYFVRETGANIRSNLTFSLAAVLTVAVMGTLVGSVGLARYAVDNATRQFQGGVELIIYLDPEVSNDQFEAIRADIERHQDIERYEYFDRERSYEEALDLLADTGQPLAPEDVPTSFRIVPREADTGLIESLEAQFDSRPGVLDIVAAKEIVDSITGLFDTFQFILIIMASFLLVAALLLIYNGIRVAMFARRREVEVQKLVGATNWFIRLPFVMEGMVHGLAGGLVGSGLLIASRRLVEDQFLNEDFPIFSDFTVTNGELQVTVVLMVIAGVLIGGLGSAFAAGRYLDV
jgi:cell division transport system permease protein